MISRSIISNLITGAAVVALIVANTSAPDLTNADDLLPPEVNTAIAEQNANCRNCTLEVDWTIGGWTESPSAAEKNIHSKGSARLLVSGEQKKFEQESETDDFIHFTVINPDVGHFSIESTPRRAERQLVSLEEVEERFYEQFDLAILPGMRPNHFGGQPAMAYITKTCKDCAVERTDEGVLLRGKGFENGIPVRCEAFFARAAGYNMTRFMNASYVDETYTTPALRIVLTTDFEEDKQTGDFLPVRSTRRIEAVERNKTRADTVEFTLVDFKDPDPREFTLEGCGLSFKKKVNWWFWSLAIASLTAIGAFGIIYARRQR